MGVHSTRGPTGPTADPSEVKLADLDEPGQQRTLRLTDDESDGMRVYSGEMTEVLKAAKGGALFRYVAFQARDLGALVGAYAEGFGELAKPIALAKAILLDDDARVLVSVTVWADRAALDKFLEHDGFGRAQEMIQPFIAGPPKAENLKLAN